MGFSTILALSTNKNTLNGRGTLAALSAIDSGPLLVGLSANTQMINLTAYVTNGYITQDVYNGSETFVANQNGVFSEENDTNVYPVRFYRGATSAIFNTLQYNISATGNPSSSGIQVASLRLTLSSTALSGGSAGDVPVAVTPLEITVPMQVFTVNTPFQGFFSLDTFTRRQQYLG